MAHERKIFTVFVASPSDLSEERRSVNDVFDEINLLLGDTHGIRFEPLKWETHTRPDFGIDAQDVINKQIGDEYDVFIGMMWGRFGSPTTRSESGTMEEFDRALARWKSAPNTVHVMFYFKDAGLPPSQIDPEQLSKVQAFKKLISEKHGGLYHQFEGVDEFKAKLRIHLSSLARELISAPPRQEVLPPLASQLLPNAVLDHFSSLTDDDYEEGVIELSERSEFAVAEMVQVYERLTECSVTLGNRMRLRTEEMNKLTNAGTEITRDDAKRVANDSADDIENFVKSLFILLPEFKSKQQLALELMGKVIVISNTDFNVSQEEKDRALASTQGFHGTMIYAAGELAKFRQTIAMLPRMTTAFNRARRRAVALLDDLYEQMQIAVNTAAEIESQLSSIPLKLNEN
jgi:hypothetical protein